MELIGLSGSLRKGSFNSALLRAAAAALPEGVQLTIASIAGIPLYDGDIESNEGIPASVEALKQAIIKADGLILASPEYNNSLPGVFKNAIDWLSRPPAAVSPVFGGKPVALMGASPSQFGTALGQAAWLPVLRTLGARPWFGGRLTVAKADKVFDPDGGLSDAAIKDQLRKFMAGFAEFIRTTGK